MNPIIEEHVTEEHISTADLANAGERAQAVREDPAVRENQIARDNQEPLLPQDFVQDLRTRWDRAQTGFVDEPRGAVQQADELVATTIKRLAESFADERSRLEQQWDRGENVNTEDLRQALRRYRSFFQRLLSI
jgi:hypothetical protein